MDFKYLMEADLGESPTNLRKAPIFFCNWIENFRNPNPQIISPSLMEEKENFSVSFQRYPRWVKPGSVSTRLDLCQVRPDPKQIIYNKKIWHSFIYFLFFWFFQISLEYDTDYFLVFSNMTQFYFLFSMKHLKYFTVYIENWNFFFNIYKILIF